MFDRMLPVFRRRNEPEERTPQTIWDMFETMLDQPLLARERLDSDFVPAMEVRDKEGELEVRAELPGMDSRDVDVSVENNQLIIRGEKREEKRDEKDGRSYSECLYGSFYRTIPLSSVTEPDKIKAKFKNGVLTIKVPKSKKEKGHKIAIES
ncbi:MAG: Hsp20/alpha crystallin family protein [Desulfonatronovibrionaceae bacterium]